MWLKHDERGVAMVTVILIGAALTAVSSMAAFATIQEFRAGSDDRRGAEALAYAEAGVDRLMQHLKSGLVNYKKLNRAGCEDPPYALNDGSVDGDAPAEFQATLTVYNPVPAGADRFPPAACVGRPSSPHPGQGGDLTYFVIRAVGQDQGATRVVRQVIALKPIGLPIGIYANRFDPKAHPKFENVSLFVETTITERQKIGLKGDDSYYKMADLFPGGVSGGALATDPVPAAAHAVAGIFLNKSSAPEFQQSNPNCSANGQGVTGGSESQSLWDSDGSSYSGVVSSGCDGEVGWPNSSKFTAADLQDLAIPTLSEKDFQVLKNSARIYGVYCSFPTAGTTTGATCHRQGQIVDANYMSHVDTVSNSLNHFVIYFDFLSGTPSQNQIDWGTQSVWGCNEDPDIGKSVVAVVRNGGVNAGGAGNVQVNGAFIIDGDFNSTGNFEFNGSLISGGTVSFGSSAQKAQVTPCWVSNMPGPFFNIETGHWSEVDR